MMQPATRSPASPIDPRAAAVRPRLSIAFFSHPNHDVLIECLASQGPAKHPPVLAGEYRDRKDVKTGLTPSGARG